MKTLPHTFDAARRASENQDLAMRALRFTGTNAKAKGPMGPVSGPLKLDANGRVEDVEGAKKVASQFENLFVQMMVSGLRSTADVTGEGKGMFGDGPGSDQFTQWFDQNMSNSISKGMDLGVSKAVVDDLKRWGKIASDDAPLAREQDLEAPDFRRFQALKQMDTALRRSDAAGTTGGFHATV